MAHLPEWLDWLLSVVEPLIVLVVAMVVAYFIYGLVFSASHASRLSEVLKTLNDDWKVVLLLLIPLFYRTVRVFLEQTEEAFGMKRKRPLAGQAEAESNPPKTS